MANRFNQKIRDVEMHRFESASMSFPANSTSENEESFVAHTRPQQGNYNNTAPLASIAGASDDEQIPGNTGWKSRTKVNGRLVCPEEVHHKYLRYSGYERKSDHLLKSGPLAICNDPDCVDCPGTYKTKKGLYGNGNLFHFENKIHNILYGDAESWLSKTWSFFGRLFPVMNPHTKMVQRWNRFFVISCLVAIFIDPLFFYLFSTELENKCIVLNWSLAISIAIVRSLTDLIYLLHMLLQFRVAYVAPESRVVGTGDLVDQPKRIALHYLRGYFLLDLFVVFPLPQVVILIIIPKYLGSSAANYAKSLIRVTVLLQYIPRIFRFVPLITSGSSGVFIFESAWANFIINLLMFVMAGHVIGSCWYLFALQRVNQCLHDACKLTGIPFCTEFIDCGRGYNIPYFVTKPSWRQWLSDGNSTNCFTSSSTFNYGIYQNGVMLTTENGLGTRYIYSLAWGFLQISTLAGNQIPSYFIWEVLFMMSIVGLGLLLFALLIGNMQNFLQALGRRRLEMQLRQRDVERWMKHRRLPEELRRQVRQAERFKWAATRGVEEDELLRHLPEDLQREIRRQFFKFLKNVRIFSLMDEPMLDAVYEKLHQRLFIRGSYILYEGGTIEKMLFIVRGKLESIGADGNVSPLSEGDVCGEELLSWCLERSSSERKDGSKLVRLAGHRLLSNRTVRCLTNVEGFALRAADLEEVTILYSRFLRNPKVQGAIRYESPYWRTMAAVRIQVAWKYRQRVLKRPNSSDRISRSSTTLSKAEGSGRGSTPSFTRVWHDILKENENSVTR